MILIIDNGSQYTHLIKRNCRDLGFESEILNNKTSYSEVKTKIESCDKIILSGGPSSVYLDKNGLAGEILEKIKKKELTKPILGICYGHQLIAYIFGGKVEKGKSAEYGITKITTDQEVELFIGCAKEFDAWASHFDEVKELPKDFVSLAHSEQCACESMKHKKEKIYSVQFHPEVWHTKEGEKILKNFLDIK
ncbi:MAG: GMP synthase subunit A [Candidatus Micrarchaeota archaeon]